MHTRHNISHTAPRPPGLLRFSLTSGSRPALETKADTEDRRFAWQALCDVLPYKIPHTPAHVPSASGTVSPFSGGKKLPIASMPSIRSLLVLTLISAFGLFQLSLAQNTKAQTITSLVTYQFLDPCAQGCFVKQCYCFCGDMLEDKLGCGHGCVGFGTNDCICRNDKQSVAVTYLSKCIEQACTVGNRAINVNSGVGIYTSYCSSLGYSYIPEAAVTPATMPTTTGGTLPQPTAYVTRVVTRSLAHRNKTWPHLGACAFAVSGSSIYRLSVLIGCLLDRPQSCQHPRFVAPATPALPLPRRITIQHHKIQLKHKNQIKIRRVKVAVVPAEELVQRQTRQQLRGPLVGLSRWLWPLLGSYLYGIS